MQAVKFRKAFVFLHPAFRKPTKLSKHIEQNNSNDHRKRGARKFQRQIEFCNESNRKNCKCNESNKRKVVYVNERVSGKPYDSNSCERSKQRSSWYDFLYVRTNK